MTRNRFKQMVDTTIENTEKKEDKNTIENALENNIKNTVLEELLIESKKNKKKSHTFYLTPDIDAELTRLAKKTKQSKSVIVDKILRKVLLDPTERE